ncbi:hypothetical protein POSPLADRAFT_1031197 [Postia placenta MAD-698-R-SB12]|uniref:Uncharacterized protein n=1 Tax=Postia placenta MAD-698-R-SB12 TaxID=670580 RepID=A0A1X6NBQ8_9APHY|nr:hypothetical protein POSPLADRAFT_1031197 [Postia placenta MAD-698-R-SB12]OSX66014.1 hypothetical protein POSPLADRAFT_1031197 [Postia placenta MAD-698-R-SB12]
MTHASRGLPDAGHGTDYLGMKRAWTQRRWHEAMHTPQERRATLEFRGHDAVARPYATVYPWAGRQHQGERTMGEQPGRRALIPACKGAAGEDARTGVPLRVVRCKYASAARHVMRTRVAVLKRVPCVSVCISLCARALPEDMTAHEADHCQTELWKMKMSQSTGMHRRPEALRSRCGVSIVSPERKSYADIDPLPKYEEQSDLDCNGSGRSWMKRFLSHPSKLWDVAMLVR